MRKILALFFLSLSFSAFSGQYAKEANANPFLNGELNPKYEGELIALSGDIVEIIEGHKGKKLYKLNLNIAGLKHIWVTSFAPFAEGEISINSKLIFRGYIASSDGLDSTGKLKSKINSETLLLALKADSVK
ncbi:hypothetical protein FE810_13785 [Thalassotalea litorea]|uniref:DNA-binding protein n=1 Tax=Thalassotalea litorea TaxID=2020715 RepID=A0A5R9IKK9_9GAMM|nr:hypothetical protein [Thalassotalea litorea]TLU61882.1 hypothetical protein FE810_13785 [Thalassotalea litorea]